MKQVLERLAEIEQRAMQQVQDVEPRDVQPQDIEELESLEEDAEQQGQLKAYICPDGDIEDEGNLALDLMEEWNVPKRIIDKLRGSLGQKLKNAQTDPKSAHAALRHIRRIRLLVKIHIRIREGDEALYLVALLGNYCSPSAGHPRLPLPP